MSSLLSRKCILWWLVLCIPWNLLSGQIAPDPELEPGTYPDRVAKFYGQKTSVDQYFEQEDSLNRRLCEIEIDRAELNASKSNIWHRLVPEVRLSANLGINQVLFVDPTNLVPYVLPRDAYRLTLSISLNEMFDYEKHTLATLQLERLQTEYGLLVQHQKKAQRMLASQRAILNRELELLHEQSAMVRQLLQYYELLFQQGKTGFDRPMRVRLQLLDLQKTIMHMQAQQALLQPSTSARDH